MIAYVKGILSDFDNDSIVVDANGIGYTILVPDTVISTLPSIGSPIKVYTYLQVREDAFSLFGFLTKDDLAMFKKCISVTGIGPKAGLAILSLLDSDALRIAIISGDVKTISQANGVGKKTAERLILELRDKVDIEEEILLKPSAANKESSGLSDAKKETVEALTALGYSASDALKAVNKIEDSDNLDSSDLLKAALKNMF